MIGVRGSLVMAGDKRDYAFKPFPKEKGKQDEKGGKPDGKKGKKAPPWLKGKK